MVYLFCGGYVDSLLALDVLRTYRISQFSEQNSMTISNLSIVFGPTLFSQGISNGAQNGITLDPTMQNKVRCPLARSYPFSHIHSPVAIANRPSRRSWSITPTSSLTSQKLKALLELSCRSCLWLVVPFPCMDRFLSLLRFRWDFRLAFFFFFLF